uniref:S-adenosylmethionine-dependent methyltransferase n=1 Tax=Fervidobacterium pennivorans TaxID=93466 RepID=A0A832IN52_FERPE
MELAKGNVKLNGLNENEVRWVVDDVRKFVSREIKRGRKYDAFILDPPEFGRGTGKEIWKLEEHLGKLLEDLMILCDGNPLFVFLTCYSDGFSPSLSERILRSYISSKDFFTKFELKIPESPGNIFSSNGACAIFISNKLSLHQINLGD